MKFVVLTEWETPGGCATFMRKEVGLLTSDLREAWIGNREEASRLTVFPNRRVVPLDLVVLGVDSEGYVTSKHIGILDAIATRTLYPAADWHDDDGPVLWWHLPIQEPPYVGYGEGFDERRADGSPSDCCRLQRSGWLTHWSYIPKVEVPK